MLEVLRGNWIQLKPLNDSHRDELYAVAQDESIWTYNSSKAFNGEQLPDASSFDFLIIMGGPQSPLKLDKYLYLRNEIALAKQMIKNNKSLLGICLGAQIIAEALGAKIENSPNKEIGSYPIEVTKEVAIGIDRLKSHGFST